MIDNIFDTIGDRLERLILINDSTKYVSNDQLKKAINMYIEVSSKYVLEQLTTMNEAEKKSDKPLYD